MSHQAEIPKSCIQCLESDSHAKVSDKLGIVTTILNCMSNHVVNLETNSSHIASDSKYQPLRDISEECSKRFLSSKKKLVSAMFSFKRESMMMLKTL